MARGRRGCSSPPSVPAALATRQHPARGDAMRRLGKGQTPAVEATTTIRVYRTTKELIEEARAVLRKEKYPWRSWGRGGVTDDDVIVAALRSFLDGAGPVSSTTAEDPRGASTKSTSGSSTNRDPISSTSTIADVDEKRGRCQVCDAAPGEPCVTLGKGTPRANAHAGRK